MKIPILGLCLFLILGILVAAPVGLSQAANVIEWHLQRRGVQTGFSHQTTIESEGLPLAHVFSLASGGYVVVCADDELPPVIAYSFTSGFSGEGYNPLEEMLKADISLRLKHLDPDQRSRNRLLWEHPLSTNDRFEQWPPEGSSPTGGWLKTLWTQNAPYSDLCPIDPVTGIRSLAGCPAVAMAQIVNYHQTLNGTAFSDDDDYYHSYAGRNYWIDDDAAQHDFPDFPTLNSYLGTLMQHYNYGQEISDLDKAALVFACGVAAHQVYTSSGSGTFAVSQAFAAIQRFGFQGMELLTDSAPGLYNRMAQNMMEALPVHLAVVTPAWDAGHNVVVDGYNTNDFFHLNFGWGGSYNGWYLLPSQIPYNLTVIEGAIVDIQPREYLFSVPEVVDFTTYAAVHSETIVELINISPADLLIEAVNCFPVYLGEAVLGVETVPLPHLLTAGQSLYVTLTWTFLDILPRTLINGSLEVIHEFGVHSVPMLIDPAFFYTAVDDPLQAPPPVQLYPNPFGSILNLKSSGPGEVCAGVYNLKGQRIKQLQGSGELSWDGSNEQGDPVANGIYLLKLEVGEASFWQRVMKLK